MVAVVPTGIAKASIPAMAPLSDPFDDAPAALISELTGGFDKEQPGAEDLDKVGDMKSMRKSGRAAHQSNMQEKSRICLCGHEETEPLIQPCECTGTMQYVHKPCLVQWLNTSYKGRCEVCFFQFKIKRDKTKLKNWKPLPMTSTQKAKYGIIFSLHILALVFFIWSDYTLIGQCMRADKDSTGYWIKLAIIVVATIAFLCFGVHQSRVYVRLYERISVYNMAITNVFGKEENVSRFSKRDDLTMTSGMFDRTSGGSIGGFFDMQ